MLTTMADGHIFGSKASEPEISRLVKKCNFYLPHLHLVPLLGLIPSEFLRYLLRHKIRVVFIGYHAVLFA